MSEHIGQKKHKFEDIGDKVDHISNIPDCFLSNILSFMPTKDVVKTSILSTRWKNLWAFVPTIDFDDELLISSRCHRDVTSFGNFVDRVLKLRDASNLEKFRLSCWVFRDASKIHSWISNAIMHNVQELDLAFTTYNPSMIPRSMFDSTSLVTLKIRTLCVIEFPSHASFPCLKTFHLTFVRFLNDDSTEKLFSSCPVVEELELIRCCFTDLNNITISSSTLKRLTIDDDSRLGVYFVTNGCKIKIDAPNLTYFAYTGYLLNEIFLNNTPSLEKSFIDILNPDERLNEVACRAIDLFKQLQCVVSLKLSNETMETLLFAEKIRFPVFRNLTYLILIMEVGMNHAFRVLMGLLSVCPVLQSICFSEGFMRNMHIGEKNSVWSSIPKCISNCLKTVTFKNFHGYNSEMCFLKCVLKYACVLERIDIWWSESYLHDLQRKTKVRKDLGKIKKSYSACVIKFS